MSYNRVNWNKEKPINTTNLNAMDEGIAKAHEALEGVEKPIDYLSSSSTAPVQSKVVYTTIRKLQEQGNVTDEQVSNAVENYFKENPSTDNENEFIPHYWLEHLNSRINDIKALQDSGGKDCFSFVVLADMHWGSNLGKRSPQLIKCIMEKCGIKKCLILGDTQSRGAWSTKAKAEAEFEETAKALSIISGKLRTQGNHDGSWGTFEGKSYAYNFLPNEIYNRIYRNVYAENPYAKTDETGTAYYVDDDTDKVRYIMLNTHCNAYVENEDKTIKYNNMKTFRFGQSQYDFLCNDALATVPEGYSVIIGGHAPISNQYADLFGGTEGDAKTMRGVLTAYRNKATYSREWAGTAGGGVAYKNLADTTSNDWKAGYRLNSSGIATAYEECVTTNYIPVKDYDVVRVKGINLLEATGGYVCGYNADKTKVGNSMKFATYPELLTKISDNEYEFNTLGLAAYDETGELAYVRFSGSLTDNAEAVVIAVNEEIIETEHGYDYVNINADFTQAKGELVGYFSGHTHADYINNKSDWGVNIITHSCDAKEENDNSIDRVIGTISEQSFDVVTVNKITNTIHITKIGAGSDRSVLY